MHSINAHPRASDSALTVLRAEVKQEATEFDLPVRMTGNWGVDLHVDVGLAPGDDFFGHVNGKWIEAHPIPTQLTSIDNFTILAEQTSVLLRELIQEMAADDPAPGSAERRIVDAYAAFLDTAAIDSAGVARAQPYLDRIRQATDRTELLAISAEPGFSHLIELGVTANPQRPQTHILSVAIGGMGLPARNYYFAECARTQAIRAEYQDYLTLLLEASGYDDAASSARQVLAFEWRVAGLQWPPEVLRDPDLAGRVIEIADLAALAPSFPIKDLLLAAGVGSVDTVLAKQVPPTREWIHDGGLPAMMRLLAETPLPVLKAHLTAQFLNLHAAVLGTQFDDAKFNLYDRMIRGRAQQQSRWKRAIRTVESQLRDLLGAKYVGRYFPADSKAQMERLVADLLAAMRESLITSSWLGEATKQQALAKLAALDTQIGYGETFETYDGLAISADHPLANEVAAARWKYDRALERLSKPVDRNEWPFAPQTVNASYREERNQIIFPAGILQPPFFDPKADPAVNYGAIGAIIGHEIGHGFDDRGTKYDASGALQNWWQEGDKKAFDAITSRLVEQYNDYCPLDQGTTCINGRLTLGENIGDLVGLELAYRAYRMSLGDEEPQVVDGYTGDQRFFLAFAQVWRGSQREELLRCWINSDPHSPPKYRVNGSVRNMDAWYEAFGITPDNHLYLSPEERVRIW